MKTMKLCSVLCIVLAFSYCNAAAQKPIVPNHDKWVWGIDPDPSLPCLVERIEGMIVMDGFFTNSSVGEDIYKWNYHEKGEGTLIGETTGSYELRWVALMKEISFDDGSPRNSFAVAHTDIRKNGKLFMTINFQYNFKWDKDGNPVVVREVFKPECK